VKTQLHHCAAVLTDLLAMHICCCCFLHVKKCKYTAAEEDGIPALGAAVSTLTHMTLLYTKGTAHNPFILLFEHQQHTVTWSLQLKLSSVDETYADIHVVTS
jgi:hypothetical protein